MEETAKRAKQIVCNPTGESSRKRYKGSEKLYRDLLVEFGSDPDRPDFSASRNTNKNPVNVARALILHRCSPKSKGWDGLKAMSTGGAIKSAVVNYWRSRQVNGEYVQLPGGSFTGNPGRSPDLQSLIKRLDESQRLGRTNLTRHAYQQTHEDVRQLY